MAFYDGDDGDGEMDEATKRQSLRSVEGRVMTLGKKKQVKGEKTPWSPEQIERLAPRAHRLEG